MQQNTMCAFACVYEYAYASVCGRAPAKALGSNVSIIMVSSQETLQCFLLRNFELLSRAFAHVSKHTDSLVQLSTSCARVYGRMRDSLCLQVRRHDRPYRPRAFRPRYFPAELALVLPTQASASASTIVTPSWILLYLLSLRQRAHLGRVEEVCAKLAHQ